MALGAAAPSRAGDWHVYQKLRCSDCHTMHNKQELRYDGGLQPVPHLLRSATATQLCLACHDGSNPSAPGVIGPTLGDPPGGGFPADLTDPLGQAHRVDGASVTPPDGQNPITMSCTTCHDPHGSRSYRNLRDNPSRQPRPPTAPVLATQLQVADGANAAQVYTAANVTDVSGMSSWCLDCHDQYETKNTHAHSVDRPISGGTTTSYGWWVAGAFLNRARVQTPGRLPGDTRPAVPSAGNQVFCLTCHKAHGSTIKGSILDLGVATDPASLCNQCHNQ
jgi:predicted CXXCH cytochrome family protein